MGYTKVHVRRPHGIVDSYDDLDEARRTAGDGDVLVKCNRGGHVEYEVVIRNGDRLVFVDQPPGWKPRMPVYRGGDEPGPVRRTPS
jgi:hypothetical protein